MRRFEWVRQGALDSLGAHADPRAREVLMRAEIDVEPSVVEWTGSSGRMEGHRVRLWVDARRLGTIRGAPALEDALRAAVAIAVAARPGEVLHDLSFGWTPAVTPTGYRDPPPANESPDSTLGRALVEYLHGAGEETFARAADRTKVRISRSPDGLSQASADIVTREGQTLLSRSRLANAIERALRDLLGERNAHVIVRHLPRENDA